MGRFGRRPVSTEVHQAGGLREFTTSQEAAPEADLKEEWKRMRAPASQVPAAPLAVKSDSTSASVGGLMEVSSNGGPLIAHAAELAVTTKDFSHSRSTF